MNINLKIDVNPSDLVGIVLSKFIEYKQLDLNSEELQKFVKLLLNDEEFIEASKKIVTINNK